MPCYPAFALLLGSAMATEEKWIARGTRILAAVTACAALAAVGVLFLIRNVPTPGDISAALSHHPGVYSLSLGHMEDLTLQSFAYLRLPLGLAALAFCVGAVGAFALRGKRAFLAAAVMMILFYQAARLAMVAFDPYLSSRPLAEALERSPEGGLITYRHYYPFSSIFFYTNRTALLLDGRRQNLVYGSYAPGAPDVFIDDARFQTLWSGPQREYLAAPESLLPHLTDLVGEKGLNVVVRSGGKLLLTNQIMPVDGGP